MKSVLLSGLALLYSATFAWAQRVTPPTQNTVFIPIDNTPGIDYKYHDGVALLRNGTLLRGRFQSNGNRNFTYRASSQAPRQKFGASSINRLSLVGSDTLVSARKDSTVFVRFGNRLYRQLATGSTMVLDRKYTVDEDKGKYGHPLYIIDNMGKRHKFKSLKRLNNWFYTFQEQTGQKISDAYLNQNEIVKGVAQLNDKIRTASNQ